MFKKSLQTLPEFWQKRKSFSGSLLLFLSLTSLNAFSQTDSLNANPSTPVTVPAAEATPPVSEGTEKVVSGKVVDKTGEAVIGAVVSIKGTNIGAATDVDGAFSVKVSEANANGILVISYVGYTTQEFPIATTTDFNITLLEDEKLLDEVVVIGYGTQENKDVTGAVSVVKGEDLNKVVVVDAAQALQGRAPGINVVQNTGAPGSPLQVRIRGVGTNGVADPLYILNGMPVGDLSFLNPNDIENISVLKDASATAIYGNRGANGVVIVTTKKGSTKKTTFDFNMLFGVSKTWKRLKLLDAKDWATLKNESDFNDGLTPKYNPQSLGAGTNWQDQIFTTGKMNSYSLSASGATEKSNYFISGGYLKQTGIVKNSGYERYNFSANNNLDVGKRFTLGTYANIAYNERLEANDGGEGFSSVIGNAIMMDPVTQVNSGRGTDSTYSPSILGSDARNPVSIINNRIGKTKGLNFTGSAFGEYKFLKYFKYKSALGLNYSNSTFSEFQNRYYEKLGFSSPNSSVTKDQTIGSQVTWTNSVVFEKTFAEDHKVEAIGLMEYIAGRSEYFRVQKADTRDNDPNTQYLTAARASTASAEGLASEYALRSFMARGTYEFRKKYLVTGTVRRDESSIFAKSKRAGYFPSFSLGWKVSEESFFQPLKPVVTFMKIRAGYGLTGNQRLPGSNPYYPSVTSVYPGQNYTFSTGVGDANGVIATGVAPISQGNPNATWEKNKTTNIAMDLGLFRERILFTIDYFVSTRVDMLLQKQVPYTAGLEQPPYVNGGKIQNKGVELSATYRDKSHAINYSIGGNITFIKNKVIDFGLPYYDGVYRNYKVNVTQEGSSVAQFYGLQTDGIVQTQAEADALQTAQPNVKPGDFKYKDLNGDGVINDKDRTNIGSPLPKFTYGFNADLSYKNFDLSMFFQGSYGNKIFNGTKHLMQSSSNYNKTEDMLDRWTGPGSTNDAPRLSDKGSNNLLISDYYIESGSYLRLKVLQIGYSIPTKYIKRIKMERVRVFVGAQNLLTITKYSGFDPEIGQNTNNVNGQRFQSPTDFGVDRGGTYPQARTWQFGINASF
jgi:TonB-dependent starch-binding outer membrane protein SusC